jgi:hypothetical protein
MKYCNICNAYCNAQCVCIIKKLNCCKCPVLFLPKQPKKYFVNLLDKTINLNILTMLLSSYNQQIIKLNLFKNKYNYIYDRFKELYFSNELLNANNELNFKLLSIMTRSIKNMSNIKNLNMIAQIIKVRIMNNVMNKYGVSNNIFTSKYF